MSSGLFGSADEDQLALKPSRVQAAPPPRALGESPTLIPGMQDRPYSNDEIALAFEIMDLDRRGVLSASDIRRTLDLCGLGDASAAEVDEMLRLVDHTGQKQVTFEEFSAFFTQPPPVFRNFDFHLVTGVSRDLHDGRTRSVYSESLADTKEKPLMPATNQWDAVEAITNGEPLTPEFVKQVYARFVQIDVHDRGFLSYDDFCRVVGAPQSPDMWDAFVAFDTDRVGELDLRQFVVALSMFAVSPLPDKVKFAFMMYDEDQVGSLPREELIRLLKSMAPQLTGSALERHASRLYSMFILNPNAQVSLPQLIEYVQRNATHLVPRGQEGEEGAEEDEWEEYEP